MDDCGCSPAAWKSFNQSSNPSSVSNSPRGPALTPRNRIYLNRHRRLWLLGVQTKADPLKIMTEVFRILRLLGMKWVMLAPFKLKTLYEVQPGLNSPLDVKIGLQLYKSSRHNGYVIDLQKISGQAFPFMDLCAWFVACWTLS